MYYKYTKRIFFVLTVYFTPWIILPASTWRTDSLKTNSRCRLERLYLVEKCPNTFYTIQQDNNPKQTAKAIQELFREITVTSFGKGI